MVGQAEEEERVRWATPLGRMHGGQRQRANTRTRRIDSCRYNSPLCLAPNRLLVTTDMYTGIAYNCDLCSNDL